MESFEEIYVKYYKKVYRFLYRLSGSAELAEELTQETLYNAFLHINQYQGRSNIFTWLCQIAKNNWLTECNRQKHFDRHQDVWQPVSGHDPEKEVIEKQMLDLLRKEIKELPEPYLSVCILRVYAELSYGDIAAGFGKSENWARVTFFRGKAMLTERMERFR